jgi:hypothetical protein
VGSYGWAVEAEHVRRDARRPAVHVACACFLNQCLELVQLVVSIRIHVVTVARQLAFASPHRMTQRNDRCDNLAIPKAHRVTKVAVKRSPHSSSPSISHHNTRPVQRTKQHTAIMKFNNAVFLGLFTCAIAVPTGAFHISEPAISIV